MGNIIADAEMTEMAEAMTVANTRMRHTTSSTYDSADHRWYRADDGFDY